MDQVYKFDDLVRITKRLRAKDGCPWDKEQTHESLRGCMKEEAYEVVEAIENEDAENLCEELGDVLLQVTMHAEIAEEEGEFKLDDITTGICEKLIRRHPHVFGDKTLNSSNEVIKTWDEIKRAEKNEETVFDSVNRVPLALPACTRTQKILKKIRKADLDVDCPKEDLVLSAEQLTKNPSKECVGKMLFEVLKIAENVKVDGEEALNEYTRKYIDQLKK